MSESIKGKKLNKGEWAEFYVMMKLLGEGRLYSANALLEKNYQSYLDVLKIIRQELETQVLEYVIDDANSVVIVKPQDEDTVFATIPNEEFTTYANMLFDGIKGMRGSSVPAPDPVCDFAKVIYVSKPKAPAVRALKRQFGGKNDIFIEARDGKTSITSIMGFSIKSKFSDPPSLFNAGASSQFLYRLNGFGDTMMEEFNAITDEKGHRGWAKCKEYLADHGISLEFVRTQNVAYNDNLSLITADMAPIMAWCAKDRLIDSSSNHQVMETVERMIAANPLNYSNPRVFYEKFMKDFLMASFTGMTAANEWDGREQVNGGYIAVMDNGDVLCYHSIDREAFRDYLYRNTFFDQVGSKKYEWSYVFKEDGEYYLPLNFSIRFNRHTR